MSKDKCEVVTNSWLDDKLPLAGLWFSGVEVMLFLEKEFKTTLFPYYNDNET